MNRRGNTALIVVGIVLGSILLVGLAYMGIYNGLVTQRVGVDAAWSEVQNQYQRRYDLIPQLVNATKLYINYEREVLTEITALRSQWAAALASGNINQQMQAQGQVDSMLSRLLVIANGENYPQLKADQTVLALMDEISGTQNRVAVARGRYIDAIQEYNTAIRTIPANIVAGMSGMSAYPNYTMNTGADTNPTIPIG